MYDIRIYLLFLTGYLNCAHLSVKVQRIAHAPFYYTLCILRSLNLSDFWSSYRYNVLYLLLSEDTLPRPSRYALFLLLARSSPVIAPLVISTYATWDFF